MLLDLIRYGFSIELVVGVCSSIFVVFCTLPIHEFAHAFVATKLGDGTPKLNGRLTINPFAHLDLWGCLMIILVGFGYAKPVPVNMRNFKNPKAGMAITALAGPVSNILMAFLFMILRALVITFGDYSDFSQVCDLFFFYAAYINITLAVFNLIPIPPLDGSRILTALIPNKYYYKIMQYERYIMIGLFVLLFTGILSRPLSVLSNALMNLINTIVLIIFSNIGW